MKVINCAICDHIHAPEAHNSHCPVCGAGKMTIKGQTLYVDVSNARCIIKGNWSWSKTLKDIVAIS